MEEQSQTVIYEASHPLEMENFSKKKTKDGMENVEMQKEGRMNG